jgi:peptidyl-prolyl cis-trans isomerase D
VGEATMVETPDGFVVATLAEIQDPDPKADPAGWSEIKEALGRTVADDLQSVFASAVRDRGNPHVTQATIDNLAGNGEAQ